MEQALRAGRSSRVLQVARELVTIVASELSDEAVLVGAGELTFEGLLTGPAGVTSPAVGACAPI